MIPISKFLSFGVGLVALLSLIDPSQGQTVTLPANIAIDLVFPRNDTYNPADTFPVVFALQGASAAWTFGFFFEWRIRRAEGCQGECGVVDSGRLSVDQGEFGSVSFGDDDYYLYRDESTALSGNWGLGVAAGGFEGAYSLEWDFGFLRNCSDDGGILQSEGGRTQLTGSSTFSVVPGASPDIRRQLEECPVSGGVVGVQANLNGCPSLGTTGVEADPCVVEVPDDVVDDVVAQLAAGGTPEQPGAPPIPGVPLPGGPPGVTTIIGYPSDDGGTQTTSVADSITARASSRTSSTAPITTGSSSAVVPSAISSSASRSAQTSAVPTTVVVNESANTEKRSLGAAVIAALSMLVMYML
ncbi:hypothetical protein J7T55_001711 [Diaporthe amygdali]|uniref:uncharacterized protein n=1 Tax=Phomopsis amygdali TaxID=1214568 RepID=UPI0022FE519C|nr:uncharacterized protein J7T55_001711 [Diaporthe amygdali]KAJ0104224.1 hypothetical protein J7T55_001711 [Diaporthe amygdali]